MKIRDGISIGVREAGSGGILVQRFRDGELVEAYVTHEPTALRKIFNPDVDGVWKKRVCELLTAPSAGEEVVAPAVPEIEPPKYERLQRESLAQQATLVSTMLQLRRQVQDVEIVMERLMNNDAHLPRRKDRELYDWMAQVLQVLISDRGVLQTLETELIPAVVAFVIHEENEGEGIDDLWKSNSMDIPVEFMKMVEVVRTLPEYKDAKEALEKEESCSTQSSTS